MSANTAPLLTDFEIKAMATADMPISPMPPAYPASVPRQQHRHVLAPRPFPAALLQHVPRQPGPDHLRDEQVGWQSAHEPVRQRYGNLSHDSTMKAPPAKVKPHPRSFDGLVEEGVAAQSGRVPQSLLEGDRLPAGLGVLEGR